MMLKPLLCLLTSAITLSSFNAMAGSDKNYFFFQATPNLQQSMQYTAYLSSIMKPSPVRGLSFDLGYSLKVYKNLNLEAGIGGNLFHYAYRLQTQERASNTVVINTIDGEYPFAFSAYIAPTYDLHTAHTGTWKFGAGLKIFSISESRLQAQQWSEQYNLQTNIGSMAGLHPALTVFIQKQIIPAWKRLEVGLALNYIPDPIFRGNFEVESGNRYSAGNTRFHGSSAGVNLRYSLR